MGFHFAILHAVYGFETGKGQIESCRFHAPGGYVFRVSVAGPGIGHGWRAHALCAATDLRRAVVPYAYVQARRRNQ